MPPFWWVVPVVMGAWCLLCALVGLAARRTARRLDRAEPIDSMVDVVSDDGPVVGCDCEDCDLLRAEYAMHTERHPDRCACDPCWAVFIQRMRDIAARQAAELDKQEKRR
jgi:hypothetical protein